MPDQKALPPVLYKYMGPDRADFFKNRQMAFSGSSALNDIFEMQPMVDLQFLGTVTSQVDDERHVRETLAEAAFILCLSESWDNIPMWSYYAQAHQGFVVGLHSGHAFFEGRKPEPVEYCKEYPVVNHATGFRDAVFKKFEQWKHECEWRSLAGPLSEYDHPVCREDVVLQKFSADLIAEVILGHRMDKRLMKCLLKYLFTAEYQDVTVYQTKPVEHNWKLERTQISQGDIAAYLQR
jgi:hypothetical protein